jgi:hypothetical protein
MDEELQALRDAFDHYPPHGANSSFVDMFVMPNINTKNVREVFRLLASHSELNSVFWSMVNHAPSTEEGWKALMFIGSGMSDEALQEKCRQRLRHAVEIVRGEVGSVQVRWNGLFRSRR